MIEIDLSDYLKRKLLIDVFRQKIKKFSFKLILVRIFEDFVNLLNFGAFTK